jgi:hypothetical protein
MSDDVVEGLFVGALLVYLAAGTALTLSGVWNESLLKFVVGGLMISQVFWIFLGWRLEDKIDDISDSREVDTVRLEVVEET